MENFDTLLGLVKRYSPSGFESEAVMWLVERMQFLGYTKTFVDDTGNAIGIKGKGEKTLLLLGHIDTVIGNIPINISENSLFGRGTVDAKGPLSAFVDAVSDNT
jgi:LysW-gamma-L-lysine carboxypeptidase